MRDSLSSQRSKTGGSLLALLATVSGVDASRLPLLEERRYDETFMEARMTAMMDARLGSLEEERRKRIALEKRLEELRGAQEVEVKKQLEDITSWRKVEDDKELESTLARRDVRVEKRLEELVVGRIAAAETRVDATVEQRQSDWRHKEIIFCEVAHKIFLEAVRTMVHNDVVAEVRSPAAQQMFQQMVYGEACRLANTVFEQKVKEMKRLFLEETHDLGDATESAPLPPPVGSSHPFDPPGASASPIVPRPTPHPLDIPQQPPLVQAIDPRLPLPTSRCSKDHRRRLRFVVAS